MNGLRVGVNAGSVIGLVSGTYTPTVAATLDVSTLDPVVTNGTNWAATLTWDTLGTVGNGKTLYALFLIGPAGAEARDNQQPVNFGSWIAAPGTIGVLVSCDIGDPTTVSQIEAAINSGSSLASVTTADPSPSKEIDSVTMDSVVVTGTFSGGV